MPKKRDLEKDMEIREYLKTHSYRDAVAYFHISHSRCARVMRQTIEETVIQLKPKEIEKMEFIDLDITPPELPQPKIKRATRALKSLRTKSYEEDKNLYYQKVNTLKNTIIFLKYYGVTKDELLKYWDTV